MCNKGHVFGKNNESKLYSSQNKKKTKIAKMLVTS
jgi:hypothetical protein